MDQASRLLKQAPFDQATVHLLCRVLEDGWAQIRTSYRSTEPRKSGVATLRTAFWPMPERASGTRKP
jgi:hypothetical protein